MLRGPQLCPPDSTRPHTSHTPRASALALFTSPPSPRRAPHSSRSSPSPTPLTPSAHDHHAGTAQSLAQSSSSEATMFDHPSSSQHPPACDITSAAGSCVNGAEVVRWNLLVFGVDGERSTVLVNSSNTRQLTLIALPTLTAAAQRKHTQTTAQHRCTAFNHLNRSTENTAQKLDTGRKSVTSRHSTPTALDTSAARLIPSSTITVAATSQHTTVQNTNKA